MTGKQILLIAATAMLACWIGSEAAVPDVRDKSSNPFSLSSTTFKDGATMPVRVSNIDRPGGPANCVGQNVSPQLSWSRPPDGTRSFVITVSNPEGHAGLGFTNLVAYGIPATVNAFAEGELSKPSDKFVGGKNSERVDTYSGPCPGLNVLFHYTFMVIATNLEPGELPPGLTLAELNAKLEGHVRRAAAIVGLFTHP
jgi:Raf kinase inhibitor-like YbhB/YbcL family protein